MRRENDTRHHTHNHTPLFVWISAVSYLFCFFCAFFLFCFLSSLFLCPACTWLSLGASTTSQPDTHYNLADTRPHSYYLLPYLGTFPFLSFCYLSLSHHRHQHLITPTTT